MAERTRMLQEVGKMGKAVTKRVHKRPVSKAIDADRKDRVSKPLETQDEDPYYPPEVKETIYSLWLPRIFSGVMERVLELPPEHRNHVLEGMGQACAEWTIPIYGIRADMSWEELWKHLRELEPPIGPTEFSEADGIGHQTYFPPKAKDGRTRCMCPIVTCDIIPNLRKKRGDPNHPLPELCMCSAYHELCMFRYAEAGSGKKVNEVETVSSVQINNATDCRYVIHIQPSASTTPKDEP